MPSPYVLAVDQGTSSTKAVAIDAQGRALASASRPIGLSNPRPGWVEQDPEEILRSVEACLEDLLPQLPGTPVAVGLSNQRESALAWDTTSKRPLSALLGWQDRRTAGRAAELHEGGLADEVRARCGLPLDPMFSALKLSWILDDVDPDRRRASNGEIRLGTLDAFLLDRLTGEYRVEAGNASRTQLLNIKSLDWDDELLEIFRVPRAALPAIARSDAPSAPVAPLLGRGVRAGFGAVMGDSHAALFGHGVRRPGVVKATFGTGSSIMGLTERDVPGDSGMVHTLGWLRDQPARAYEGNILATGGTLVWLAKVFDCTPDQLDDWARTVDDAGGVTLVPAFAGLGAPYWDAEASATLTGFDLGTSRAHIAYAAFASIAHQIEDVLSSAEAAGGSRIDLVLADGGPTRNDRLMQLQADISGRVVGRPDDAALSATGVAHMAGVSAGLWSDAEVDSLPRPRQEFRPLMGEVERQQHRDQWAAAVSRSRLRPTPHRGSSDPL